MDNDSPDWKYADSAKACTDMDAKWLNSNFKTGKKTRLCNNMAGFFYVLSL